MSLARGEVQKIANLARLALDADELEAMTRDLGSILDHMTELSAAPADDQPPMGGVSDHPAPYREDVVNPDALRREVGEFAPAWIDRFFVVPRLAALDADALDEGPRS